MWNHVFLIFKGTIFTKFVSFNFQCDNYCNVHKLKAFQVVSNF